MKISDHKECVVTSSIAPRLDPELVAEVRRKTNTLAKEIMTGKTKMTPKTDQIRIIRLLTQAPYLLIRETMEQAKDDFALSLYICSRLHHRGRRHHSVPVLYGLFRDRVQINLSQRNLHAHALVLRMLEKLGPADLLKAIAHMLNSTGEVSVLAIGKLRRHQVQE